jgi:hypothetical protein
MIQRLEDANDENMILLIATLIVTHCIVARRFVASVLYLVSVVWRYLRSTAQHAYMLIHLTDSSQTQVELCTKQGDSDVAVVTQEANRVHNKICKDVFLAVLGIHSLVLLHWVSQAGDNRRIGAMIGGDKTRNIPDVTQHVRRIFGQAFVHGDAS